MRASEKELTCSVPNCAIVDEDVSALLSNGKIFLNMIKTVHTQFESFPTMKALGNTMSIDELVRH
jgi:hypothetical protein